MKAARFFAYGGPDVLRYDDVDPPRPSAGQVLVRVAATSFNPVDATIRGGYLKEVLPLDLPHTPGIDLAGSVEAAGDDVTDWSPGDRVIGLLPTIAHPGAAAEFALAPAHVLARAPSSIPLADAAAVPCAALTAWQAVFEHAQVRAGQRLLINGAGGAVGGYAIQLATRAGVTVVATASPRSHDRVLALGADQIVDYTTTTLAEADIPAVDALLNLVFASEAELAQLSGLVAAGGVLVSTTSPVADTLDRGVHGVRMFVRSDAEQLGVIVDRIDRGELRVDVSRRYPLADIAVVHQLSDSGRLGGKVVLLPAA